MTEPAHGRLSKRTKSYVLFVSVLGFSAILFSLLDLYARPLEDHRAWLPLAILTLASGWLSVKLPAVGAVLSVSETFVIAGTLLYGPAIGTTCSVIDALVLTAKESWKTRQVNWPKAAFNLAAAPLSIWVASRLAGVVPAEGVVALDLRFATVLGAFTALYFLLNTWLVSFAVALEHRLSPFALWRSSFMELFVTYAAGASIATFLVVNTRVVDVAFVAATIPLLLVIYITYRWSSRQVQTERDKVRELNRVFLSTVEALALAIDAKDQVTHGHIRRVQRYTMALARALGVRDQRQLDAIRAAALLHDTGKLAVPEYILNKPGPLTAAEFEKMKIHADVGADIIRSITFPYPVEPIVRHHHEQWNGTGYPAGLSRQEIPLGARILSVVDCYDALTSDRPYRPRMTRQEAEAILQERRGKAYDPWVVDQFIGILDELEAGDEAEAHADSAKSSDHQRIDTAQLDVISATTAEEREFAELRRELGRATGLSAATEVLFKYLRRLVPLATLALYIPRTDTNELVVAACYGIGESAIRQNVVALGDRVSGWAFAHSQAVLNSDAALELGPVVRTLEVPLRYVAALPVRSEKTSALMVAFASNPFEKDHRRLLETAATLFGAAVSKAAADGSDGRQEPRALPSQSLVH